MLSKFDDINEYYFVNIGSEDVIKNVMVNF